MGIKKPLHCCGGSNTLNMKPLWENMKPFTSSCIKFVRIGLSYFYVGVILFFRLGIVIFFPIIKFALAEVASLSVNTRFVAHRSASFVPG